MFWLIVSSAQGRRLALLGHEADPGLIAASTRPEGNGTPWTVTTPPARLSSPKMARGDLGPARPDQAGHPDDLPGSNGEGDVVERRRAREVADLQHRFAEAHFLLREKLGDRAPDYQLDHVVLADVSDIARGDELAVAKAVTRSAIAMTSPRRWEM